MGQGQSALALLFTAHDVVGQGDTFIGKVQFDVTDGNTTVWPLGGGQVHGTATATVGEGRVLRIFLALASATEHLTDDLRFTDYDSAPAIVAPSASDIAPNPCESPTTTLPSNESILCPS